jgi:uncharacterized protein (DUF983 family)
MKSAVDVAKIDEPLFPREMGPALMRGWRGRYPNCGRGRMFRAFLKVADQCPACGEPLHHHRADDAPAYFVIMIVGHLIVPLVFSVEVAFFPPYWVHLAIWLPLTAGLSLALLQPVKGTIVAWQWAQRMHGFNPADADDGPPLTPRRVEPAR